VSADRRFEKLRPDHRIEGFDCGREELNRYLLRYAWQNQQAGAAQTYVGLVGNAIIGYPRWRSARCPVKRRPNTSPRGSGVTRSRSCCSRVLPWIGAGTARVSVKHC
jgi:hypothetical protein